MLEPSSTRNTKILTFGDYLRTHPKAPADYAAPKRRLASRPETHRGDYQQAMTPIIQRTLARGRDTSP